MSTFPKIMEKRRGYDLCLVVLTALLQATAAAFAAVATRDVFSAFLSPLERFPTEALIVLAGSGLVIASGRIEQATIAERLGQSFAGEVRERLFTHLSRMPRSAVQNQRRGGLSLRFVGDLSAIRGWIGDAMPKTIAAGLVLPAACAAGFLLHPKVGFILFTAIMLGVALLIVTARRMRPLHRTLRRRRARLSADMSERAPQAPDLRLIGRMGLERKKLKERTTSLMHAATARRRAGAIMRAVPDVVAACAAASILAVALSYDLPASLAAGGLAAAGIVIAPLRDLATIWDRYSAYSIARGKCVRVFQRLTLPTPCPHEDGGRLSFQDVFHGPLQGIGFEVSPGEPLIVTGENGSGKSTLLRLAAGLEQPQGGEVQLGGAEAIRTAPSVGVCLIDQHTPILAGTLRRCLTLGAGKRPTDKRVLEVTTDVGLSPLIERLGGLEARIAEFGRNLSDGERWRVLIARAILSRANLILIDCPDRGLDTQGLAALQTLLLQTQSTVIVAMSHGQTLGSGEGFRTLRLTRPPMYCSHEHPD